MSFKRDIIIVNQFSVKRMGKGTKGNTPGKFVLRYMARDGATELLTPVKKRSIDNFITRYMARDNATETADSLDDLGHKFTKAQGLGGRSFGKVGRNDLGDVSLSDSDIRSASRAIQTAFDQGHTVMESVISFDGNYLKKHDLVDQNIQLDQNGHALKRGAYRGKLDQMKLRLAIMQGLDKMANRKLNGKNRFDSLAYVGVIQVDTKQVHCHLAMTDLGKGQLVNTKGNIEQKGVLNSKDMQTLRQGINNNLDQSRLFKRLSVSVTREKQNARSYVKRFTEKAMQHSSFATILLAALPSDKRKWRANSHSQDMQQANSIMSFYVDQVLKRPDSGYNKALEKVADYAKNRQRRENLSMKQYHKLINQGQDLIHESCMNSAYDLLKKVPDNEKKISTKVIDGLTSDIQSLREAQYTKSKEPQIEFTYHLRAYTDRLDKARKKAREFDRLEHDYEKADLAGKTQPESKVVQDFYQEERDYYQKIITKYQTLMPLMARRNTYQDYLKRMRKMRETLNKLRRMQDDAMFDKLSSSNSEMYGLDKYGIRGGKIRRDDKQQFNNIVEQRALEYRQMQDTCKIILGENNKKLGFDDQNNPVSVNKLPYKFNDIKMLDLHNAADDDDDLKFSRNVRDKFIDRAIERRNLYLKTAQYAMQTQQPEILNAVDMLDIEKMSNFAQKLQAKKMIKPKRNSSQSVQLPRKKTVSLDNKITKEMRKQIIDTLENIEVVDGTEKEIN